MSSCPVGFSRLGVRLLAVLVFLLALGGAMAAEPRRAMVIGLDGAIGPASAAYVLRGLETARHEGAAVVVLRLDTPGGLDSAMREIVRAMLASPIPVLAYVAPSGARAASAGTFLLYAAALAAMAPGTNLGAATPVSLFGETPMPKPDTGTGGSDADQAAMVAKVTNDSAAYIRGLAALHGRNADWGESAVRSAASLPADAALSQHAIDLIAVDVADLLAKADGRSVVVHGRDTQLSTQGLAIEEIAPDWRDRMLALITDPSVLYLLLIAGVFGLVVEFTHPGVFAPGVLGTICLLIGGYGLNLLPVDYAGLALMLFGVGLMIAEAFVPAFGAFVVGGAAAFAVGSLMLFDTAGMHLPPGLIAGTTLGAVLLFGVILVLLLRTRRRPQASGNALLIGREGEALTWAGREGEVMVQGERWRARATQSLRPNQRVRVIGRDGLVLLVESANPSTGERA